MNRKAYPGDVRDEEWAFVLPLTPRPKTRRSAPLTCARAYAPRHIMYMGMQ